MKKKFRKITAVLLAIFICALLMPSNIAKAAETKEEFVGFSTRTSAPVSGGAGWQYYSPPINNYPLSPYNNGNCTWYAYGRAYEAWGTDPGLGSAGDAGNWYSWATAHGYAVGSTPRAGSIICWGGHVAFVESVSGDSVTFTESNYQFKSDEYYPRWNSYTTTHPWTYTSGFQGYIYLGDGGSSTGDLGDGFYALITHMASWNHLTNEENGNVDICYENYTANQYWKFYRQSDGSYIIKNAATGKCLEIAGGSAQDGANIQVWDQNNSDAQKWELIPCGNGYQLKAKCTNCVMEMNAGSF